MKSAYELAMERLQESDPNGVKKLSDEQKKEIADLESRHKAKIAEKEIFLGKQLQEAQAQQDLEAMEQIKTQLSHEKARLEEELEAKKERIRNA